MAPLLTQGHHRTMLLNQSSPIAINPAREITEADLIREKEKISRYLNIKERNGRALAERENRIKSRIRDMEKKAIVFEK